jgi:hypothetical protein
LEADGFLEGAEIVADGNVAVGNLLNDASPFSGVATAVVIPVTSGS